MLTEKKIQSLKSRGKKPYRESDSNGLGLIVMPTGYLTWQYRYHIYENGKRKEKTFTINGGYPTISLKQARAIHRGLRERVLNGEDIQFTKNLERKKSSTVKESFLDVAEQWLEVRKTQVQTEDTWKKEWSRIDTHILGKFGNKKLDDITTSDIFKQAQGVAKSISIDTAKRVVNVVSKIYKFAITLGKTDRNIATDLTGLLGVHEKKNRKAILDTDTLGKWVYTVENNNDSRDTIGCYIRIIAHLGLRPSEVATMKWSEIDFKNQIWNFEISKTKRHGIKEFRVYLTDQVMKILEDVKKLNGDKEYVFASYGKKGYLSPRGVQYRMADLGFTPDIVVPYGFRSTMETLGIDEIGVQFEVVDLCLAHKPNGSLRDTYNKATRWKPRVQFYKDWSDLLQKLKTNYQKTMIKVV